MTLYEKLLAAELPVISADETGAVSMGAITPEQQELFQDILLEHFQPDKYAELLEYRATRLALKDEYLAAITTLQNIQNATNPTNAQVIAAVKYEAKTLERLLKFMKANFV